MAESPGRCESSTRSSGLRVREGVARRLATSVCAQRARTRRVPGAGGRASPAARSETAPRPREPDVTTPRGPQPFAGQEKRLRLLAFVRQDSVVRVDKRVEDTAMVWPHLLVIEFIAAMLWSIGLFVIAAAFNAPLQDHATPDCTPNPSKAPWY